MHSLFSAFSLLCGLMIFGHALPFSEIAARENYPLLDMEQWLAVPERFRHPDGKPKRPPNAFICYRAAYHSAFKIYANSVANQKISKLAGISWKSESQKVRQYYQQIAQRASKKHQELFPDYAYRPQRKCTKSKDDAPYDILPFEVWWDQLIAYNK